MRARERYDGRIRCVCVCASVLVRELVRVSVWLAFAFAFAFARVKCPSQRVVSSGSGRRPLEPSGNS